MNSFSAKLFKYRSYMPIPFVLVMLFYHNSNIWSMAVGLFIALVGEYIRLMGVSWAGSETRTTGTVGGTYLIISGPFGHLRNPLYFGNILMYFGFGIMSNALFPYLQFAGLIFFSLQYHFIVKEEENYLRSTYGKDYEEYVKNVPRFFPRLTRYRNEKVAQPPFNLKAGFKSERRTLQAFSIITLTLFLLWFFRRLS